MGTKGTTRWLATVAIVALVRCGGEEAAPGELAGADGSDTTDAFSVATPTDFLRGLLATLCAEATRCLYPNAYTYCDATAADPLVAAVLPTYEAALASGDLVFDGSKAPACFAALSDPTCAFTTWNNFLDAPGCVDVLVGQVPEGGACREHVVCAGRPDVYCDTSKGCPGTCARKPGAGEPCEHGTVCAMGLTCGDGGCKAVVAAGPGEPCDNENGPHCAGLLTCAKEADGDGSACRTYAEIATLALGEACWPYQQHCLPGLACRHREGAGPICVEVAGPGDPCGAAVPDMCPTGTLCNGTSADALTCVPWPEAGQPCNEVCQAPARCVDGLCVVGLANGQPCQRATECLSGACTAGACAAHDLCFEEK